MKRVNGYIDLEDYFKKKLKTDDVELDVLSKEGIIKSEYGGSNCIFWFNYLDCNILFKTYDEEHNRYSELISEEFAKYLGLKSAHYDLASFGNLKGVISYDFKEKGYNYIELWKILEYYKNGKKLLETEDETNTYGGHYLREYKEDFRDEIITNLEDIWNAIEFYFYDKNEVAKDLVPKTTESLMNELTDYFCFQILTCNNDMHYSNITVAVKNDFSDVKLAPLYDNENMYGLSKRGYLYAGLPILSISRESRDSGKNFIEILEEYLKISDSYFVDKFKFMFYKLEMNTIYELIERVEKRIERELPNYIAVQFVANYKYFYDCIKMTLEKQNLQK